VTQKHLVEVAADQLERMAQQSERPIEIDPTTDRAYLRIGGIVYCAPLAPAVKP